MPVNRRCLCLVMKCHYLFILGMYDGHLLGDSGYPCRKYLLTPYADADTPSKVRFNTAFGRTRVRIEQTFGILKWRFSCLQRSLHVSPEKPCLIILACAILHNIAIDRDDIIPNAQDEQCEQQQQRQQGELPTHLRQR